MAQASISARRSLAARICGRIGRWQQGVSDSVHAPGEKYAAGAGWTVTRSTGRFGFGARIYRDPRFDQLAARRGPGAGR
jgi:hypothetical protein